MPTLRTLPARLAPTAVLVSLLLSAGPAARAAAPPEAKRVELVIDTSGLEGLVGERLQAKLKEGLRAALDERGFVVVSEAGDVQLEARVEMPNVRLRQYVLSLELTPQTEDALAAEAECLACSEQLVVEELLGLLPGLTQELAARELAAAEEVEPEPAPELVEAPTGMKLGPIGLSGAIAIVGGVATVGAGVLMTKFGDGDLLMKESTAVVGLSSVGASAVLLGTAAMVVDLVVLQRQRSEEKVHISLDMTPSRAGLSISGRF